MREPVRQERARMAASIPLDADDLAWLNGYATAVRDTPPRTTALAGGSFSAQTLAAMKYHPMAAAARARDLTGLRPNCDRLAQLRS